MSRTAEEVKSADASGAAVEDVMIAVISPDTPGSVSDGTHYIINEPNLLSKAAQPKTIVCIHGIGGNHAQFDNVVPALVSSGFRVVRYDLIGRGYSAFPEDNRFDGAAHVRQLRRLIEFLNLHTQQYSIIAHSMGGAIAALYVEQYHKEIEYLVLLAPAGLIQPGLIPLVRSCCGCFTAIVKSMLRSSQEKAWRSDFTLSDSKAVELQEKSIENLRSIFARAPSTFEAFWQSVLQFPLYGLDHCVARIATFSELPVLLMWGERDSAVTYSPNFARWKEILDTRLAEEGCASVRYITYHDLGHGFFVESPDRTSEDLVSFFREELLKIDGDVKETAAELEENAVRSAEEVSPEVVQVVIEER
jgi:pimeloyl-ACP methyl ester carboxylesterase